MSLAFPSESLYFSIPPDGSTRLRPKSNPGIKEGAPSDLQGFIRELKIRE